MGAGNAARKTILLMSTGGTIASRYDPVAKALISVAGGDELLAAMGSLAAWIYATSLRASGVSGVPGFGEPAPAGLAAGLDAARVAAGDTAFSGVAIVTALLFKGLWLWLGLGLLLAVAWPLFYMHRARQRWEGDGDDEDDSDDDGGTAPKP